MQVFSNNASFESNINDVKEYTLGDPRVICRILSDNLYSNKIGSIVRELSANALDAHRMVGKENVPFQVCLPGLDGLFRKDESVFSIRDYGPGLCEEDIYALYTSYGSSSKRSDNSQIGGFGIGSKSPFAYADIFTVTSWNSGLMSKYICFLSGDGSPCIKKIESGVSDEPSGMLIEIGVKNAEDAEIFRNECNIQYPFYDVVPNGGPWKKNIPVYENEYGKIYSTDNRGYSRSGWSGWHNWSVLYGHVNNSIYRLAWESSDNSDYMGMNCGRIGYITLPFLNSICILNISGTDIDLSASREDLAFTEKTKTTIIETWKKFISKVWNEIFSDINEGCKVSRFETFYKWKEKKFNFSAFKEWIASGRGTVDAIEKYDVKTNCGGKYLPIFIVERDAVWPMLENGLRGYEATMSSSRYGIISINKIVKSILACGRSENTLVSTLKTNAKSLIDVSGNNEACLWELLIEDNIDFKLIFFNKDATFAAMKEKAKEIIEKSTTRLLIHMYAVDDAEMRKKIVEAYGCPKDERCIDIHIAKKKKNVDVIAYSARKEQIKARVNMDAFGYQRGACGIDGAEVLQQIRSNLKEEWMTRDEIESLMACGAIVVVTNGISVSEKYNNWQIPFLSFIGCICPSKLKRPSKWILLNEVSYQKLLNSGFKPLEKLQAVKTIVNILKECGIEYIDFLKWMVIESLGDSFGFSRIEDACDFSVTIAPKHAESAISKAIMTWSHVKNTLSSKMSGLSRLPYKMIEGEHSFYVDEERKDLIQTVKNDLAWNEINEWIKKNPIVEFARRVYADDSRKNRNVEILNHYLKWD